MSDKYRLLLFVSYSSLSSEHLIATSDKAAIGRIFLGVNSPV